MAEITKTSPLIKNGVVEWAVPVAAVALVFVMLVPLPSVLLDILLAASITASVLVLLSDLGRQLFSGRRPLIHRSGSHADSGRHSGPAQVFFLPAGGSDGRAGLAGAQDHG
jgi:hypothetical protein